MVYATLLHLLDSGKDVEVPVYGLSMFPMILPGDKVLVRRVDITELKVGDPVFFKRGDHIIFHRLSKFNHEHNFYLTKGDGLKQFDSPFKAEHFIGKAIKQCRGVREVRLLRKVWLSKVMVFLSPLLGFFFFYLARIWQKMRVANQ